MGDLSCASGFGRGGVEISAVICACDCDSECVGIYKCEGFGSVAFLRGDVGARPPESGVMLLRLAVLAVDTCTARPSNAVKNFFVIKDQIERQTSRARIVGNAGQRALHTTIRRWRILGGSR